MDSAVPDGFVGLRHPSVVAALIAPRSQGATAALDVSKTYQTIEGWGGATAFYAGWIKDHPYKQEIYTNAFAGLNLSMLRLGDWFRCTNVICSTNPRQFFILCLP